MHIRAPAIIVAIRAHGEHGAVVRALTAEHGLQAGYVRGGRSTRLRPILQPGNSVIGEWRARTDDQLGGLTLELIAKPRPAIRRSAGGGGNRLGLCADRGVAARGTALSTAPRRAGGIARRDRRRPFGARLGGGAGAL